MADNDTPDDTIFSRQFMFKMTVDPTISAVEFKHKIIDQHNENNP